MGSNRGNLFLVATFQTSNPTFEPSNPTFQTSNPTFENFGNPKIGDGNGLSSSQFDYKPGLVITKADYNGDIGG